MEKNKKDIFVDIQEKGISLTAQRKKIIDVLIKEDHHLTAMKIYDLLRKEDNGIGLATIYRTLDLLEKKGIVVRRDFDSDTARYEIMCEELEHNHLICKKCGKIIEIPDVMPENIDKVLLKGNGFECISHSVKFYGYCNECRKIK